MGAKGVVNERMEMMKDIGQQMKAIKNAIYASRHETVARHASIIQSHAARMPDLFPEGSDEQPSEALPAIWLAWSEFTSRAEAMGRAAAKLATAAKSGDDAAVRNGYGAMAGTCSGCHTDFRMHR